MLQPGDRVRIVSPASPPTKEGIETGRELFESWGLTVEVGKHVFDDHGGFLAGTDDARTEDLNDAFADPSVRAVIASRGGKGAYRIADRLDFDAIVADPKPLVGFSEITILHLAILQRSSVPGVHGPFANWSFDFCGHTSADLLRRSLMSSEPITVSGNSTESTAVLTTGGVATGPLIGGNLDMIRTSAGSFLPDLTGAILFIEDPVSDQIGRVDRSLHQLLHAGLLDGIAGVAVGQFGSTDSSNGRWTPIEVLRDVLGRLGVPVLGGLRLGHGLHPETVPIGTPAVMDADARTLTVESVTGPGA